jgi:hypothetical protein
MPFFLLHHSLDAAAQAYRNLDANQPIKKTIMVIQTLFLLSLAAYGLAHALPCLGFLSVPTETALAEAAAGNMTLDAFNGDIVTMNGLELTMYGAIALLLFWQVAAVGWLANPLYFGAVVLFNRQRYLSGALVAVLAAIVGGVGTTLAFQFPLPTGSSPYSSFALQHVLPGFWLWLSAPVLLAVTSLLCLFRSAN